MCIKPENELTLLQQCIASGQVEACQIVQHAAHGDMPDQDEKRKRQLEALQEMTDIAQDLGLYDDTCNPMIKSEPAPSNDDQEERAWEARQAELKKQYPEIAGDFKVFEICVITESGCNAKEGEFSVHVSEIINGWVSKDDVELIYDDVWNEIDTLNLPEEGTTQLIAYESGEREDVFWLKYFRIVPISTPAGIDTKAQRLIDAAKAMNQVVTIDLRPRIPLAMGNYDMVVDVRPARERGN